LFKTIFLIFIKYIMAGEKNYIKGFAKERKFDNG